VVPLGLEPRTL